MTTGPDLRPPSQHPYPAGEAPKQRNTVGIIALITALVGAIFAMIPGALILAWVLLPAAFVLSIVSLVLKNQKRGQGIAALIISIIGTVIGVIVFFAVVATSIDEAFNDEPQIAAPDEADAAVEDDGADQGKEGSRDNPLALGTTVTEGDWEVTVNSVDLDATDAVLAENPLNDEPDEGHSYITANVTATYLGSEPSGDTPSGIRVEYVTPDGNSFDSTAEMVIVPDYFNPSETLYEGASATGNFGVQVPIDDVENGQILLSPTMFGDGVFFETQ